MYKLAAAVAMVLFFAPSSRAVCPRAPYPVEVPASPAGAAVRMANTRLDLGSGVGIYIHSLQGRLVPLHGGMPSLSGLQSILVIDNAKVSFEGRDSAALMNNFVLKDSAVKNIDINTDGAELVQSAKLHGLLSWFTVRFRGEIRQESGLIYVKPRRFTGDWLGFQLENHIGAKPEDGMCVDKNDIFLDPPRMLQKLLLVKGPLTDAFVRDGRIFEIFGQPVASDETFIELQDEGRPPVRIATNGATWTLASVQQQWDAKR